jgi:hypothetical protein
LAGEFTINDFVAALSTGDIAAIVTALAAMAVVFALIFLAVYIYAALALMAIAKKTKTPNGWLAWIPIANLFLIIQIAKQPWWHIFALLIYAIPAVGGLAFLAITAFWWWKVAENINREGWQGILMVIPIVNLIMLGVFAWGK